MSDEPDENRISPGLQRVAHPRPCRFPMEACLCPAKGPQEGDPVPDPREIYVFQNGMAMVFDKDGKQIPELQGPWEAVRNHVLTAIFLHEGPRSVTFHLDSEWKV